MRPTVYIETTIPSYYLDDRPDLARDVARTREWWDQERQDYECFISPVGGIPAMTQDGPIVDEVRRRAMSISERYGHDPRKYLEHLKRIQEQERDRVVGQPTVVRKNPPGEAPPPGN
ncbi:MAG: hypothetical protein JXQ73_29825 [Phycisphaerae bacterium]|nr:hypothetical protein [Phycisphaerae bacterium]